jgi:phosphoribosyl-ATP pyrophosphohydrolase/phosphoribosyl-AMP cyclohydrolase
MEKGKMNFGELKINADGLIPAIVQDASTNEVLMMAYMNEESFSKTIESGQTYFYSRSRSEIWHKGETSGHFQNVKSIDADCDSDTLLIKVEQIGVACHTGEMSCFFNNISGTSTDKVDPEMLDGGEILKELYAVIQDRKANPREGSYTNYLFDKGIDKILKKVGEESAEVIIAAKNNNKEEIRNEMSDLFYHLFVLLVETGVSPEDIFSVLRSRR